jgi:hypothetical protein
MPDQPTRPLPNREKKEKPGSEMPAGRSLLRRLRQTAPPGEPPVVPPSPPPGPDPFTLSNLTSIDLPDDIPTPIETAARRPEEAIQYLEQKMAAVTDELAKGKINQAQFQAIYTHYCEQRAIIERLMTRTPGTDAWQKVAVEGHTAFLRQRHAAQISGLALFESQSGGLIRTFGTVDLPGELFPTPGRRREDAIPYSEAGVRGTQIEGGRWLVMVTGEFTISAVIFTQEPSAEQRRAVIEMHRAFEQNNRGALMTGMILPEAFDYPQAKLFGGESSSP